LTNPTTRVIFTRCWICRIKYSHLKNTKFLTLPFLASDNPQQINCCQKFLVVNSSGVPISDCVITVKNGNEVISTCKTGSAGTCEMCDLKSGVIYSAFLSECCSIIGIPTSFYCDDTKVVTLICTSSN